MGADLNGGFAFSPSTCLLWILQLRKQTTSMYSLDYLVKDKTGRQKRLARKMNVEEICSSEGDDSLPEEEDEKVKKVKRILAIQEEILSDSESEDLTWGERIFRSQNSFPKYMVPDGDGGLISRLLGLQGGNGESSLVEGFLSCGLLRSWAISEGRCDEASGRWIFHQMLYSTSDCIEKAACKLFCDLLILMRPDGSRVCKFEWLPNSDELMAVLHNYGYSEPCLRRYPIIEKADSSGKDEKDEPTSLSEPDGPPPNMRSFLKFLALYGPLRNSYEALKISEVEKLVVTLSRCQLDRRILSISHLLQDCLKGLLQYFHEDEWASSCIRIATSFSRISPTFTNKLRAAKSLYGTDSRIISLQRTVVLQLLLKRRQVQSVDSTLESVVSIFKEWNLKDKQCDFLKLLHLLILGDIFLWSESSFQQNNSAFEAWLGFLKNCSAHISTKDGRPHAAKVRNWAVFLYQKYKHEMDAVRAINTV